MKRHVARKYNPPSSTPWKNDKENTFSYKWTSHGKQFKVTFLDRMNKNSCMHRIEFRSPELKIFELTATHPKRFISDISLCDETTELMRRNLLKNYERDKEGNANLKDWLLIHSTVL